MNKLAYYKGYIEKESALNPLEMGLAGALGGGIAGAIDAKKGRRGRGAAGGALGGALGGAVTNALVSIPAKKFIRNEILREIAIGVPSVYGAALAGRMGMVEATKNKRRKRMNIEKEAEVSAWRKGLKQVKRFKNKITGKTSENLHKALTRNRAKHGRLYDRAWEKGFWPAGPELADNQADQIIDVMKKLKIKSKGNFGGGYPFFDKKVENILGKAGTGMSGKTKAALIGVPLAGLGLGGAAYGINKLRNKEDE